MVQGSHAPLKEKPRAVMLNAWFNSQISIEDHLTYQARIAARSYRPCQCFLCALYDLRLESELKVDPEVGSQIRKKEGGTDKASASSPSRKKQKRATAMNTHLAQNRKSKCTED